MAVIKSLVVQLSANTSQFDSRMKTSSKHMKSMNSTGNALKGGLKKLAAGFLAFVGIRAMISLARKSLENFAKQEQAVSKLNATLQSTASIAGFNATALKLMASRLQGVTMFGDESIIDEAMGNLLTFTEVRGKQFEGALMAVLNMAAKNMESLKTSSIAVGKALNDPIKGVAALSKKGIQFTDVQKEMIKTMVDAGDIAGAQNLILKELEVQFGGVAKAAANTSSGALTQFKNKIGDVSESIGEALAPALNKGADAVSNFGLTMKGMFINLRQEAETGSGIGGVISFVNALNDKLLSSIPVVNNFWARVQQGARNMQARSLIDDHNKLQRTLKESSKAAMELTKITSQQKGGANEVQAKKMEGIYNDRIQILKTQQELAIKIAELRNRGPAVLANINRYYKEQLSIAEQVVAAINKEQAARRKSAKVAEVAAAKAAEAAKKAADEAKKRQAEIIKKRASAASSAAKEVERLRNSINTMSLAMGRGGTTPEQQMIADLRKQGATNKDIAKVEEWQKKVKAMEATKAGRDKHIADVKEKRERYRETMLTKRDTLQRLLEDSRTPKQRQDARMAELKKTLGDKTFFSMENTLKKLTKVSDPKKQGGDVVNVAGRWSTIQSQLMKTTDDTAKLSLKEQERIAEAITRINDKGILLRKA